MNKYFKKVFLVMLSLVFTLSMIGLVACKNNDSHTETIDIVETEISIVQHMTKALTLTYDGTESVSWSSSDTSVATVLDGTVTALKKGTAVITAAVGETTDTCAVNVLDFDASALDISVSKYSIDLSKGETEKIMASISYDGQNVVGKFSYISGNEDVATVSSDGTVTANKVGQASIIVKGSFAEASVSVIVNVNVESNIQLSVEEERIDLYYEADEQKGYVNTVTPKFTCIDNGNVVENPELEYEIVDGEETDVVDVENGKIIAKNSGNTLLSVTYSNGVGEKANVIIAVNVYPVQKSFDIQPVDVEVSSDNGWFDYSTIIGIEGDVRSAKIGGENSGFVNLETDTSDSNKLIKVGNNHGLKTLILCTRNYIYEIPANVIYTLILRNANLANLKDIEDENVKLAEDIDFNNYFAITSEKEWKTEAVFTGNLNGNGYCISNLVCSADNGLFKSFGGSIENVAIKDATINGAGAIAADVVNNLNVRVENALIKISSIAKKEEVNYNGGLFRELIKSETATERTVEFSDLIVYMPNVDSSYGFIAGKSNEEFTLNNIYTVNGKMELIGEESQDYVQSGTVVPYSDIYQLKLVIDSLNLSNELIENYNKACPIVELYSNQESIEKLQNLTNEYVVVKENLNIDSAYEWISNSNFSGVLDGQGHDLGTLFIHDNNVGLFNSLSGTVKNLSLTARFRGGASGVVANTVTGNATVENVFIDVIELDNVDPDVTQGVIAYTIESDANLTVKDVIVVAEDVSNYEKRGLIACSSAGKLSIENSYFKGFSANYIVTGNIEIENGSFKIYETVDKLIMDIDSAQVQSGEYAVKALKETYPMLFINQNNVNLIQTATKGVITLTGDIDLAGFSWTHTGTFTGTFDGNGYEIRNLAGSYEMGLFSDVSGATIKNVAFIDAVVTSERAAIIAGEVVGSGGLVVENVYISTKGTISDYSGAVAYTVHPITFKDVLMVCNATGTNSTAGTLIGRASGEQTFNNCYVVKGSGTYGSEIIFGDNRPDGAVVIRGEKDKDYFIFNTIGELKASTNVNINFTEMMRKYIGN